MNGKTIIKSFASQASFTSRRTPPHKIYGNIFVQTVESTHIKIKEALGARSIFPAEEPIAARSIFHVSKDDFAASFVFVNRSDKSRSSAVNTLYSIKTDHNTRRKPSVRSTFTDHFISKIRKDRCIVQIERIIE